MNKNKQAAPLALISQEALPVIDEDSVGNGEVKRRKIDRKFQGKESILSSQISLYVEEAKPKIPDGGWGWFVVLAAFVINAVSEGIIFTFGLLYIEFLNEFGASKSATSWIGSIFMAVPLLSGPIASAFVDKYGCKLMTVIGALICSFGFVLSSYSRSIGVMYVTFGVIGGLGRGLSYVTAVVSIAFWFEKRRTFVLGLAASGAGFGTVIFSPLSTFLLEQYGWRGTILIFAGLFANMCVCGVLMRDPDWILEEERLERKMEENKSDINTKAIRDYLLAKELAQNGEIQRLLHDNESQPNSHEKNRIRSELHLPTFLKQNEKVPLEVAKNLSENRDVYKAVVEHYPNLMGSQSMSENGICTSHDHNKADNKIPALLRRNSSDRSRSKGRRPSHSYLKNMRFRKNSIGCRSAMLNIHKYKIKASSCPNVYRNTVEVVDNEEEDERWYVEYLEILKGMTHFSLFLELHFLMLALSTIILFIWFIVPYFYLADHMTRLGYTEAQASLVLSVIGLTNTVGMAIAQWVKRQIGLGWAGDRLNVAKTYAICLILCGLSVGAMMFFANNYIALVITSALFGLFFASCFSLTPSLLAQLVSLEDFTMAYGLILLCDGIGNLTGPPLAGMLFDLTGSWEQSFYQAAFWIVVSGLLVGIIPYTRNVRLCGSRSEKKEPQKKRGKQRMVVVH
ncbi:hypothetical protein NQ318_004903 [Aromia moschata]|uniref:Major facilitator superfamily (MFS) profile domain-containing protein n=1 Tax=Aromia moschata TaxID=1265417 RepID=A0AAV8Z2Y1_9CUCU|nr:hypothetical protein NQ318_004903 [Aromia moschata]